MNDGVQSWICQFADGLPCFETKKTPGAAAAVYALDSDRFPNLAQLGYKPPFALSVKVAWSSKVGEPPTERVALIQEGREVGSPQTLPFGSLLNVVLQRLDQSCDPEGCGVLKELSKRLIDEGVRVNDSSLVLRFLEIGYVPRKELHWEEGVGLRRDEVSDADYFVRCLADVVYYAYTKAPYKKKESGKHERVNGILKRCKCNVREEQCEMVYLAADVKKKYCYFPCFDEKEARGKSCDKAMAGRGQYERRKDGTSINSYDLYNKLYNRYYRRNKSHRAFMEECKRQKEVYADNLARYELMEEWLKEKAENDYI